MSNLPAIDPFVGPPSREDLLRRLNADRAAARYRNPETGRRHFAHNPMFRPAFVRSIMELRRTLRGEAA